MSTPAGGPRIAIAHDYLTQRGGAERVVLSLLAAFPGAPVVTPLYEPSTTFPEFADAEVYTLPINRVGLFRRDPRLALPLLPAAVSRAHVEARIGRIDALVVSSSGWAHALRTVAPKLVYCHTPARWLYETDDYLGDVPQPLATAVRTVLPAIRRWDRRAAAGVRRYLANSSLVQQRIRRAYGIDAPIVHPPVPLDAGAPQRPVPGLEPGFLLTVSRKRGYKNTDAICTAVERLPDERLVVVGSLPRARGSGRRSDRLVGLQNLPDDQMRWLYANAAALVGVSFEDFGLTPIEAYSFGTPGIVLRAGGYLDSSVEGLTGVFVAEPTPEAIVAAIREFRGRSFDARLIRKHASTFGVDRFIGRIRDEVDDMLGLAHPAALDLPAAAGF